MPGNFSFLLDGVLAGMAQPGLYAPLEEDLKFLRDQGVGAIVTLTEEPLDRALVEEFRFQYLHLPIQDFASPTLEQVHAFIEFVEQGEEANRATAAHCFAGRGRTGTMLACILVKRGMTAWDAIEEVRLRRPGSIESMEQEDLIARFERALKEARGEA